MCVCGLNGHIYILGCAIAQPSMCHLFSWDGFQGVLGLCSLHSGGDEVIIPVEALDGEVQLFLFVFCL